MAFQKMTLQKAENVYKGNTEEFCFDNFFEGERPDSGNSIELTKNETEFSYHMILNAVNDVIYKTQQPHFPVELGLTLCVPDNRQGHKRDKTR